MRNILLYLGQECAEMLFFSIPITNLFTRFAIFEGISQDNNFFNICKMKYKFSDLLKIYVRDMLLANLRVHLLT